MPSGFSLVRVVAHTHHHYRIGALLRLHDERFSFLDNIGGELFRLAVADVLCRMHRAGRDEQGFACLQDDRRLAVDLIFHRACEHKGNLFARMRVTWGRRCVAEINAHLDDLASRDTQILLRQVNPPETAMIRIEFISFPF